METYQELRKRHEEEVNALPLGFAFDAKQFNEMKIKLGVKESNELYRFGDTGGFYRKVDSELIRGTFKRHARERKEAIYKPGGIDIDYVQKMFYYQMCNHEFAINYDGKSEVLCDCDVTEEELNTVPELKQAWNAAKRQYHAAAEKNGWF